MTWKEIKQAVEQTGIEEDDDIDLIQCEARNGNRTFTRMRLGTKLKLTENVAAEESRKDSEGCAV